MYKKIKLTFIHENNCLNIFFDKLTKKDKERLKSAESRKGYREGEGEREREREREKERGWEKKREKGRDKGREEGKKGD